MKKILSLLLVSSPIFSMQLDLVKTNKLQEKLSQHNRSNMGDVKKVHIQPSSIFVPNRLGSVELYHGKKGFSVRQDDKKYAIQKCFTDPMVRNITKEQLHAFLQAGYLSLNQMNDGEFSLKAKGRINGGGPAFGAFMYWVTKSVCYGTALTAAGGIAVATGVTAALAVTTGAAAVSGVIILGTVGTATAIGTTAGIVTGGAGVASAVVTSAGVIGAVGAAVVAPEATLVVGTAVTTAGGIGATIVAVETASVAIGTFFGMLPTP